MIDENEIIESWLKEFEVGNFDLQDRLSQIPDSILDYVLTDDRSKRDPRNYHTPLILALVQYTLVK